MEYCFFIEHANIATFFASSQVFLLDLSYKKVTLEQKLKSISYGIRKF